MKKAIYFLGVLTSILAITLFVASCEVDGDDITDDLGGIDSVDIEVIDVETTVYTRGSETQTMTAEYEYDALGNVVQINGSDTSYSVLSYTDGNISAVTTYNSDDEIEESITFTYSGGKLTSATETDNYDDEVIVYSLTYDGDLLDTYTKTYTTGTIDTGEVSTIENIVWDDGNMVNMDVTMHAEGTVNASATYDDYDSPFPRIDPDDFIEMFSANNILTAYATDEPSQKFVNNTVTYEGGKVKTISSENEDGSALVTLTYKTITILSTE